jgi:fido (protein-threonine AMPylation protein)
LEGNRKSLLDTRELFARGRTQNDDTDALMLLNHKDAIEFVVDAVPEYGITVAVIRNIQSLLMSDLLVNPDSLGAIRHTLVNIEGSVYLPMQAPHLLEELLAQIIDKVRQIKNPVEAAFFLWLHIAYLQPFEDGNKRTSRLCANLPLLLQNCAPLSFLDVQTPDYAIAVLAVYEKRDTTLAAELFEWTYLRSIEKYQVILAAMGTPDPFRARYRALLGDGVRMVVAERQALERVVDALNIPPEDRVQYRAILREELLHLADYNCARYRLSFRLTTDWITQGRPGL